VYPFAGNGGSWREAVGQLLDLRRLIGTQDHHHTNEQFEIVHQPAIAAPESIDHLLAIFYHYILECSTASQSAKLDEKGK